MFHRTPSGFMLDFPNGWTASVQYGPGNYCTNQYQGYRNPFAEGVQFLESNTAEVAAWVTETRGEGYAHLTKWHTFEDGQDVKGWQNVNSVMEFLNMVSKLGTEQPVKAQTYFDWGIDY